MLAGYNQTVRGVVYEMSETERMMEYLVAYHDGEDNRMQDEHGEDSCVQDTS